MAAIFGGLSRGLCWSIASFLLRWGREGRGGGGGEGGGGWRLTYVSRTIMAALGNGRPGWACRVGVSSLALACPILRYPYIYRNGSLFDHFFFFCRSPE